MHPLGPAAIMRLAIDIIECRMVRLVCPLAAVGCTGCEPADLVSKPGMVSDVTRLERMTGWRAVVQRSDEYRFFLLFATLLTFLILVPVIPQVGANYGSVWVRLVDTAVMLFLYGTILLSAHYRGNIRAILIALVTMSLIAIVFESIAGHNNTSAVIRGTLAAFVMVYSTVSLLIYVLTVQRVTANTLCASLCAYLLIGVIFAQIYSLVLHVDPAALSFPESATSHGGLRVGEAGATELIYFSFVTLTTLGYGDITPQRPIMMTIAMGEAVVGQIYLAVLVARLVGLHIATVTMEAARSSEKESDRD